jgi:hypothetical protein
MPLLHFLIRYLEAFAIFTLHFCSPSPFCFFLEFQFRGGGGVGSLGFSPTTLIARVDLNIHMLIFFLLLIVHISFTCILMLEIIFSKDHNESILVYLGI